MHFDTNNAVRACPLQKNISRIYTNRDEIKWLISYLYIILIGFSKHFMIIYM